jgi:hypothetical protein
MDDAAGAPKRHRLDVDDVYRMADAGILSAFDRRITPPTRHRTVT